MLEFSNAPRLGGSSLPMKAGARPGPRPVPSTPRETVRTHDGPKALGALLHERGLLTEAQLDALVAPTGGLAWLTDFVNGDSNTGGFSSAAAVAGYPHITVPAGFVHGLPVGLSFVGTAYSEPALIRLGYAFEQATKHRRPPQFPKTVNPAA